MIALKFEIYLIFWSGNFFEDLKLYFVFIRASPLDNPSFHLLSLE